MYKDLVEYLVKGLVDNPDTVSIEQFDQSKAVTVEITVAEEDAGRIIGKRGRVINAIRAVCQIRGDLEGKKISVELIG